MLADERPDFWIELDEYRDEQDRQFFLIHARFGQFTPSIYRRFYRKCAELVALNPDIPVHTIPIDELAPDKRADKKYLKFVSRLGYEPTKVFAGEHHQFFRLRDGHFNTKYADRAE